MIDDRTGFWAGSKLFVTMGETYHNIFFNRGRSFVWYGSDLLAKCLVEVFLSYLHGDRK